MNGLQAMDAYCPYCGEPIELLIDCSEDAQRYIEDCQVCCRPIEIAVSIGADGWPQLQLSTENDA
jgi:hypothetical protein